MNEEPDDEPPVWELRLGETLLATIVVAHQDFPWMSGPYTPTDAFEPFRHLFMTPPGSSSRQECRDRGITLRPAGEKPVREFILQIDGPEAGFKFI